MNTFSQDMLCQAFVSVQFSLNLFTTSTYSGTGSAVKQRVSGHRVFSAQLRLIRSD